MADLDTFADRIYEAAVVPELWPDVLEGIAKASNSAGGILFAANPQFSGWAASPAMKPLFAEFVEKGWAAKNPRPKRGLQLGLAGFVNDQAMFSDAEMDADPTYAYLRSIGLGWCAGEIVEMPDGDFIIFSWERRFKDGPFVQADLESLNAIAGHLNRAAMVAARLGLEKARAAVDTMRALAMPAAVLSRSSRLLLANDLFDHFVPAVVQDRQERMVLTDSRADKVFERALDCLDAGGDATQAVHSFPIAAKDDQPPIVLHLVPIRRSAQDIFSSGSAMLIITRVAPGSGANATIMQGLFDFSPAEARVAQAISSGLQIAQIARNHGVSSETVRSQLKSVFAKTGTSRQVELVRLLTGRVLL